MFQTCSLITGLTLNRVPLLSTNTAAAEQEEAQTSHSLRAVHKISMDKWH